MKKNYLAYFIACLFFSLNCFAGTYSGGSGTQVDPFLISSEDDLFELHDDPNDWDKDFKLTADLDLFFYQLENYMIGYYNSVADNTPFTGVFDGNGYNIENIWLFATVNDNVALFGYLNDPGQIKNLNLINADIQEAQWVDKVGSLVGFNDGGVVTNCSSIECRVSGQDHVGGLVGYNSGTISYSSFQGTVACVERGGGIAGTNYGDVVFCKSDLTFQGTTGDIFGGLVGMNYNSIANSFSICNINVSGNNWVGGLVGVSWEGSVVNSYATGQVIASGYVGGLVGDNESALIDSCYANCVVTGSFSVGGLVGNSSSFYGVSVYKAGFWNSEINASLTGVGNITDPNEVFAETSSNMQKQITFHATGWDFEDTWGIGENQTYPYLKTMYAGDINQDGLVNLKDVANLAQDWLKGTDIDLDGIGDSLDICDGYDDKIDSDNDYVPDGCDICPGYHDNDPDDDSDGMPNPCDLCEGYDDSLDQDLDTIPDNCDNCLTNPNTSQQDSDADSFGDACDICPGFDDLLDNDLDGVPDGCDTCAGYDDNADLDSDTIPDACDNCPSDPNPAQTDSDFDDTGDACDICDGYPDYADQDFDGIPDGCDNCPFNHNPGQEDTDGDGIGDVCDF